MGKEQSTKASSRIGYVHLMIQSLPEIFCFQLATGTPMAVLTWVLTRLIKIVAESGGSAITTANLSDMLLSWRGPVILILGILLVAVFAAFEIFAKIHLYDDILGGRKVNLYGEIGKGLRSLRRFLCPGGLLVLLYIFIAVPLLGVGFSISLSENFYIPNFIMEVVRAKPLYNAAYWGLIATLGVVGISGIFTLHGIILDKKKPSAAFRDSFKTLMGNWKNLLVIMLLLALISVAVIFAAALLSGYVSLQLEKVSSQIPQGYFVYPKTVLSGDASDMDLQVIGYRIICVLHVAGGGLMFFLLRLFVNSYLAMGLTACYLKYNRDDLTRWPSRPKRTSFVVRMVLKLFILFIVFVVLFSVLIGLGYSVYFDGEKSARIVAHRTGGVMAPENSLEGIELSIQHGCYACETDIQRTKDGHYIINNDDDFARLTGVAKKPGDMTLAEVCQLVITDTATGAKAKVPRLEEMLDVVRGRIKLFIELKGTSADRQMVDDVVQIVREKDCVEDVALISLKYDVIDYAETRYPEFETGMLIFGALGDVTRVNCDLMVLEEEMSTEDLISRIHDAGKEVYVWTINTEKGMKKFLAGECDGIITDQIELALQVQDTLNRRSDFQVIQDRFKDMWN